MESEPNGDISDGESESIDLIYKVLGKPSDVDVFELARVLDSFGNVAREAYHVVSKDEGELVVKVKPFERGSFIMDVGLYVKNNPGVLFLMAHADLMKYAKDTLEAIGFIKDAKDKTASLIELLRRLKNGKPEKVEKKGPDQYEYHSGDNSVIPVNSTVHTLYNNPVIQNMTVNIYAPAERESVDGILTYLKGAGVETSVKVQKDDVKAIRAYSNPDLQLKPPEVLEDTTIKMLSPKSGSYGQTTGTWSFTITGTKRIVKAKIIDENFLRQYSNGIIRFYQGDRLKVKLHEKQIIADKAKMEYEIVEVLEYVPANPAVARP